jgi:pyruvate/2-oxoglutarate/acetoin dehydrogenase E1 component
LLCVSLQAIRSDNPIIFFEHVLLYNIKGETHDGDYCQSLERAEVRRKGQQQQQQQHGACFTRGSSYAGQLQGRQQWTSRNCLAASAGKMRSPPPQ